MKPNLSDSNIKCNILIVDDELLITESISLILKNEYELDSAATAEECIQRVKHFDYDVVLLDINLPDRSGLEIIPDIKEFVPEALIIMITAYDDVQYAISAFKRGIYDYIVKPFVSDKLRMIVNKATERAKMRKKLLKLQFLAEKQGKFPPLIGESKIIIQLKAHIQEIANYPNATILITGESGTGKELVAQYVHKMSSRSDKEFLDISCSSIPENLMESELFGYEKGAFTDAKTQKIGLFERATGGTLFLDEIGTLSLDVQVKLLRVLETREIRRLGGLKKIPIDIRLIAATNDNLIDLIKQGKFREDLYYRLNVLNIEVPAIRNREDDVFLLAEYFIETFNQLFRKSVLGMSDELREYLLEYPFPGNIRELRNLIERGMILCKEKYLSLNDIQLSLAEKKIQSAKFKTNFRIEKKQFSKNKDKFNFKNEYLIAIPKNKVLTLRELDNLYIQSILKHFNGSKKLTAKALNISRSSLYEKLKKLHSNTTTEK